jgi:hypothetical protein
MTGSSVSISGIDALLHRCIAAMIVRVYGSRAPHRISGGELILMERVVVGRERFAWGLTLHAQMIAQLDHCRSRGAGEFAFGSILVAFFLERVPMLRPRVLLEAPGVREPRLRRWSQILVRHGGGEGGHYFTAQAAQIWRQMPQVILSSPMLGWTSGGTRIWYCLLGRFLITEVCCVFIYVLTYVVILIYQCICLMYRH